MVSNPPTARDDRRGRWPPSRRGFALAFSAVSVTAGGVGGGYLSGARLTLLTHLRLPHDASLLLIITAGITVIVLGRYMFMYLDRRDERRHETISRMQGQGGFYQKYEDNSATYEQLPMSAATYSDQSSRRPARSRSATERRGLGDVVSLDRHQQVGPGAPSRGGSANPVPGQPGAAAERQSRIARGGIDGPPPGPQFPTRTRAGRGRSRRPR
jgi:hypothetical protein